MKTHNIFISHSWAYGDTYDRLKAMLDNHSTFSYSDYSVPKSNPIHRAGTDQELLAAIKERMQFCNVVVLLAGVYSTYSKWINKEIRLAHSGFSSPKSILAVRPQGGQRTSQIVTENADLIVSWSTNSVVDAIRKLS